MFSLTLIQAYQAGEPLPGDAFRTNWLFGLLILPFFLYMLVIMAEKLPALRMARIIISNSFANTSFRNTGAGSNAVQALLSIISLISISTFIYFVEMHFSVFFFGFYGFKLWALNTVVFGVSILFRLFLCTLTGEFTGTREAFREYLYNVSQSYKFLSLILLVINFFISYLVSIPDIMLLTSGIVAITAIFLLRMIRLFSIFIRRSLSLFYLILYLCALEIAPAMIFIKYLSGLI